MMVRLTVVCIALLAVSGCALFKEPPPAPERRVLVPCPPEPPPVDCPPLPELEGELRIDAEGKPWLDARPGALARAWLDANPVHVECWAAVRVWREAHGACIADIEDDD